MPLPSTKAAAEKIIGHRRLNTFAICPNIGWSAALVCILLLVKVFQTVTPKQGGTRETYMVKKYALATQM